MCFKCSLIAQNLSDIYLEYVKDKRTPQKMFETLTFIFERKGFTTQFLVRKEILTVKLKVVKIALSMPMGGNH